MPTDPPAPEPSDRIRTPAASGRRWSGRIDRVVTTVLFTAFGALALLAVPGGLLLGMTVAACGTAGAPPCDHLLIGTGVYTAAFGPSAVLLGATVVAVLRRGRVTAPVPLVGIVAAVGVFALGRVLSEAGAGV